jgi:Carbohydrate-selective porin
VSAGAGFRIKSSAAPPRRPRKKATVELTYLLQVGKHVALQPDLQYIMRPGTDPTRKNALAAALRFELSY